MVFHWVGVVLFVDLQNDLRPCATHKSTVQFYDVGTGLSELNHLWLLPLLWRALQGRIQDFFRRGCTRLFLYFNTNKPHIFFCRIPVVLENRRSSQEEGGCHLLHPSPRSAPALYRENTTKSYKSVIILQKQNGYQYLKYCLCPVPISSQHHWKSYWCLLISRKIPLQSWNI